MLQFIYGRPASGKTYTVLNKIKELTSKNIPCTLIVPEQFTFESERAVLKTLGDKSARNVDVLSFTRLCEEVARFTGGLAGTTLGDCDKVIFMKRALLAVSGELKLWTKYSSSVSFAKTMLDTVGEFKINSVTPQDLRKASEQTVSQKLKLKLLDIALIYETYDILTGEKYIDPADMLTKLYDMLSSYAYFKGKTVFLDSFKGFTGQQFKIIERIFSQADDIYVSLTNDPENCREFNVYTNIRTAASKIEKIAASYGKTVLPCINTGESRYNNLSLINLEALISGRDITATEKDSGITLCKAATPFDEADFAARTIRKLVRTCGYRYRDFVIIARDADTFKESVTAACQKNGVPLFYDNRIPLSAFPLARAAESAIDALNFSTESILKFHKTGLGTLNIDEISQLENYTYLWNINGTKWLSDFVADPKGFVAENRDTEKSIEELKVINHLRVKAIEPILSLKENFKGNAVNMAKALICLFDECNVSEKLTLLSNSLQNNTSYNSEILKQSYTEYIGILDSLVRCFGDISITQNEFIEALNLAVSLSDIGVIPQMLDEVTFGSADRIRPSRPKIAFILGANQGIFPKITSNAGVLNLNERKDLIEYGINIADNSVYSSIDEEYLVYCNLCCASEKLFISYSCQTVSGESLEPSAFVLSVKNELCCSTVTEPEENLSCDNSPETANAVFSEYCKRIRSNINDAFSLKQTLINSEKTDLIDALVSETKIHIKPETAQKLFGENINMSASKFDNFNRCHFSFFCRYGLSAKKLQPVDFDVMQRGTVVHYVLERFITEQNNNLHLLTREDTDKLTDGYIADYLDSINGYRSIETARMRFLISRISRSLKEVISHVCAELLQSDFKPKACELKIGKNSEMGELKFPYDNGIISLIGSIDRVDEYNGYIRIIDYKTGSKSFKLPDILFGLNLQMLIYLYAVTRGSGLPDSKAAGILYQPSKRDINDSGMAMNGLLQSDTQLVTAMDKHLDGEFVPKLSFNKDGSITKRCTSFIETEDFTKIFDYIENLMRKTGNEISQGDIGVSPIDGRESPACKYCDYSGICGIENSEVFKVPELTNLQVFEMMKEAENNGI